MADESPELSGLLRIDGVISVSQGESPSGDPEAHVVLDRYRHEIKSPLPATADGLPIRVFENMTLVLNAMGGFSLVDKEELEANRKEADRLGKRLQAGGKPKDYVEYATALAQANAMPEDIAPVLLAGLEKYPASDVLLERTTMLGFLVVERGSPPKGVVDLAAAVAKGAGISHIHHFNVGELYRALGKRRRAKRHFEQALKYAATHEDADDARERLEMLRRR